MTANPPTGPDSAPVSCCVSTIPEGITALIFDFDGTLADTTNAHEHALRTALAAHGLYLDHDWYRGHVGLSIDQLLTVLPGAGSLPHEQIIRASRTHLLIGIDSIVPFPCVMSLLVVARRTGRSCAVASGASRDLVYPGIRALGLSPQLAAVVTREDVAAGKPAPDLFTEAARRLGVTPNHCLAIDDAAQGITAAHEAGMTALTISGGHLTPVEVPKATRNAENTLRPAQSTRITVRSHFRGA